MPSYDDLIETALSAVEELQDPAKRAHWVATKPLSISMLGPVLLTPDGHTALLKLGRAWHSNDPQHSKLLSRKAAEELAVTAFGDLLGDPPRIPSRADAKRELLRIMADQLAARTKRRHFYFPAKVLEETDVPEFSIGPVAFRRRATWIDTQEQVAGSPCTWKDDVASKWIGTYPTLRLWFDAAMAGLRRTSFKRWPGSALTKWLLKNSYHQNYASDILKAVGTCEWIATIAVEGRDPSRANECATIAVLVALDGLGLLLPISAAQNLRGPGHERSVQQKYSLRQYDGQPLGLSISIDYPRVGGPGNQQATLVKDTGEFRDAVGKALHAFVDITPSGNAPLLLQRWVEATYWLGQARREGSEFIALVKYGICLDILSDGGQEKGILALVRALFGMTGSEVIAPDGRTLKAVVDIIYKECRSQISHGSRPALLRELPIDRRIADDFTVKIVREFVFFANRYTGADSYDDFIVALPALRAAANAKR